ncbi:MAG: sodium/proline symporter PutP [Lentisphaerae bacterium]|nr:sodium/proline symporter PutP [Lentisphaerota bacterium]
MSLLSNGIFISFVGYLLMMVIIGACCCNKNSSLQQYLLGGRGLGSWVTAISAQASDMSGWMLMGLPGAIYLGGMLDAWVAIGLTAGTLLNWIFIAPRLRVYTEKTSALTLPSFFARRFSDPSGLLRAVSSIIILIFFTIYAGSGLVAAGTLFNQMFGINYKLSVLIGMAAVLIYTVLGGYLAVCFTDLIQGMLMVIAVIVVPAVAIQHIGWDSVVAAGASKNLSLLPNADNSITVMAIISCAVWGLGYFGQPHILSRFMSVKDVKTLPKSITIAMTWVIVSLAGVVLISFAGMAAVPGLAGKESETVFIKLIMQFFNPYIGGIMLAAIMAAIMSTIDSQLLVSTSALTEDFYRRIVRRQASTTESVMMSRIFVVLITIFATIIALFPNDTIFGIVKFAWGGFGAAFGPVVIMALYSKKTTWISALAGMIAGTIVMLVWYFLGLNKYMYEILPGFAANFIVIFIVNAIIQQKDDELKATFDTVKSESKMI